MINIILFVVVTIFLNAIVKVAGLMIGDRSVILRLLGYAIVLVAVFGELYFVLDIFFKINLLSLLNLVP